MHVTGTVGQVLGAGAMMVGGILLSVAGGGETWYKDGADVTQCGPTQCHYAYRHKDAKIYLPQDKGEAPEASLGGQTEPPTLLRNGNPVLLWLGVAMIVVAIGVAVLALVRRM